MARVSVVVLLSVILAGCASVGFRTEGVSGPVAWHATDLRVVPYTPAQDSEGSVRERYEWTVVLQETQGTGITFTHSAWSIYEPGLSTPVSAENTGQWQLQPHGEIRWPVSWYLYCRETSCPNFWGLSPVYTLDLTGINDRGQPVHVAVNLRLPPASRPVTASASPGSRSAVPIQTVNNLVLVPATLNHTERVRLLLDTGATYTIITPSVAKRLGISPAAEATKRTLTVFGGRQLEVPFAHLSTLAVGDAVVENLEVGISPVNPEVDIIQGILGGNFLTHFTVTVDHAASRLRLVSNEAVAQRRVVSADSEEADRFTDQAKKFSVLRPSPHWEVTKAYPDAAIAWENTRTKSTIQILSSTPSNLSYRTIAKMITSNFGSAIQEWQHVGQADID